jgi:hypothetical protein
MGFPSCLPPRGAREFWHAVLDIWRGLRAGAKANPSRGAHIWQGQNMAPIFLSTLLAPSRATGSAAGALDVAHPLTAEGLRTPSGRGSLLRGVQCRAADYGGEAMARGTRYSRVCGAGSAGARGFSRTRRHCPHTRERPTAGSTHGPRVGRDRAAWGDPLDRFRQWPAGKGWSSQAPSPPPRTWPGVK